MNILAIDLGKFNSMCCFFDTKTQEYRFQVVATNRRYLTAVLTNHKIDLVVTEACGPSGWISDLCAIKNFAGYRDRSLEPPSLTCGGRPHLRVETQLHTAHIDRVESTRFQIASNGLPDS